jgi:type II secretory pathway pseudopilin PulG
MSIVTTVMVGVAIGALALSVVRSLVATIKLREAQVDLRDALRTRIDVRRELLKHLLAVQEKEINEQLATSGDKSKARREIEQQYRKLVDEVLGVMTDEHKRELIEKSLRDQTPEARVRSVQRFFAA